MNSRYIVAIGMFTLAAALFYVGSKYKDGNMFSSDSEYLEVADSISIAGVQSLLTDGVFEVEVISSDQNLMIATYDKNSISNRTRMVDGELRIDFKGVKSNFLDFGSKRDAKATVYTRGINKFVNRGAGRMYCDDTLAASCFRFGNEGVGSMDFVVNGEEVFANNNGVGSIDIKGMSKELTISNAGFGSVNTHELKAIHVVASNSGVGSIDVYASDSIALYNDGVGSIQYGGDAMLYRMSNNGIGSIDKK